MGVECLYYGGDPSLSEENQESYESMAKVKLMDIHPYENWIVTADEKSVIALWDFAEKELIKYFKVETLVNQNTGSDGAFGERADIFPSAPSADSSAGGPGTLSLNKSPSGGGAGSGLSGDSKAVRKAAAAGIRDLKFYDAQVVAWRAGGGGGGGEDWRRHQEESPGFLATVALGRVLLVDPLTLSCRATLTSRDLSGGGGRGGRGGGGGGGGGGGEVLPTCCEPVSGRLLAVGCTNGQVRLWDWRNRTAAAALRPALGGGGRGGVVRLMALPEAGAAARAAAAADEESEGALRLVGVGADGGALVWGLRLLVGNMVDGAAAPLARLEGGVPPHLSHDPARDRLVAPRGDEKAYVWDLSPTAGDCSVPSRARTSSSFGASSSRRKGGLMPRLSSSGARDSQGDAVESIRVLHKIKFAKTLGGNLHAIAALQGLPGLTAAACAKGPALRLVGARGALGPGGRGDLEEDDGDRLTARQATVARTVDLRALLPGLPRKLKVYALRQHPARAHVLVAGTNIGLFVLSVHQSPPAAFARHPRWEAPGGAPALLALRGPHLCVGAVEEADPAAAAAAGGRAPTLRHMRAVHTLGLPAEDGGGGGGGNKQQHLPQGLGVAGRPLAPGARLMASPSGDRVCVLSPADRWYIVLEVCARDGTSRPSFRRHASAGSVGSAGSRGAAAAEGGEEAALGFRVLREVAAGPALGAAWVGPHDALALLAPPEQAAADGKRGSFRLPGLSRKKSTGGAGAGGEGGAAAAAAAGPATLTVLDIADTGVVQVSSALSLPDDQEPVVLFGGTVLCVGYAAKEKKRGDPSAFTSGKDGGGGKGSKGKKGAAPPPEPAPTMMATASLEGKSDAGAELGRKDASMARNFTEGSLLTTLANGRAVGRAQFFHWGRPDLLAVTSAAPCPAAVAWDRAGRRCAAYLPRRRRWALYAAAPAFALAGGFAALTRAGELPLAAEWVGCCSGGGGGEGGKGGVGRWGALVYATATEVWVAFPYHEEGGGGGGGGRVGAVVMGLAAAGAAPAYGPAGGGLYPAPAPMPAAAAAGGVQVLGLWGSSILLGLADPSALANGTNGGEGLAALPPLPLGPRLALLAAAAGGDDGEGEEGAAAAALAAAARTPPRDRDAAALLLARLGRPELALEVPLLSARLHLDLVLKYERVDLATALAARGPAALADCDAPADPSSVLAHAGAGAGGGLLSAAARLGVFLKQKGEPAALRDLYDQYLRQEPAAGGGDGGGHASSSDPLTLAFLLGDPRRVVEAARRVGDWPTAAAAALAAGGGDPAARDEVFERLNLGIAAAARAGVLEAAGARGCRVPPPAALDAAVTAGLLVEPARAAAAHAF